MDKRPIVVDLDGTLIYSDMMLESLFLYLRRNPLRICLLPLWLLKGKAHLKRRLADAESPSVDLLPFNRDLLAWLNLRKQSGSPIVLATASDVRLAQSVADHLGLFDEVVATSDQNMASDNKRKELVKRYGEDGFEYVGNSRADLEVWRSAGVRHLANPSLGVACALEKIGTIDRFFPRPTSIVKAIVKTMRLHQWSKNLLIMVPLLAAHRFDEPMLLLNALLAFLSFGLCASAIYVFNDLLDLQSDRRHPTKSRRPLPRGELPLATALLLAPALVSLSFCLAVVFLPTSFTFVLAGYLLIASAYSVKLKHIVIVDVIVLSLLYALRVIAGAMALGLVATFWILAFCLFIFTSLAFVKRYTELRDAHQYSKTGTVSGRDYGGQDFPLLAVLGGSAGYTSVLILALYINEAANSSLYRSPEWMWAACPLLLYWLSRLWLLAHRGFMHDDPVVFALRDPISLIVGILFLTSFALASI